MAEKRVLDQVEEELEAMGCTELQQTRGAVRVIARCLDEFIGQVIVGKCVASPAPREMRPNELKAYREKVEELAAKISRLETENAALRDAKSSERATGVRYALDHLAKAACGVTQKLSMQQADEMRTFIAKSLTTKNSCEDAGNANVVS